MVTPTSLTDRSSSLSRHELSDVRIHSRLSFNSTSIHLDGYRTTLTAIIQLTEDARFYSVSVNFRDTRMPAGEHAITQTSRKRNQLWRGTSRQRRGDQQKYRHTRRRPCKHMHTQTTQHTHKPTERETGVSGRGLRNLATNTHWVVTSTLLLTDSVKVSDARIGKNINREEKWSQRSQSLTSGQSNSA